MAHQGLATANKITNRQLNPQPYGNNVPEPYYEEPYYETTGRKQKQHDKSRTKESGGKRRPQKGRPQGPQRVTSHSNYDHELPPDHEPESDHEEKTGFMGKLIAAKDAVVDAVPDAILKSEEKPKKIETRVTIELPRDILTAYILMRVNGYWDEYTKFGKFCLFLSLLLPYSVQYMVFVSLVGSIKFEKLGEASDGSDFWWNSAAFAVLFIYIWKDLVLYYNSVWFYVKYLEDKQGGGLTHTLKDAAVATTAMVKQNSHDNHPKMGHVPTESGIDTEAIVDVTKTMVKFLEFRLWIISVYILYIGITCYSVLQIPIVDTLIEKLEVALSVFFILEVDDWAYELFIASSGCLDDDEFDVECYIPKDRGGQVKEQQRSLAISLALVIGSILVFWVVSYAI